MPRARRNRPRGATMKTITLEEHFTCPGFVAGPGKEFIGQLRHRAAAGSKIFEQLQDIGDQADRRDGRGRHRHAGAVAERAGRRTGRTGGATAGLRRSERRPCRSGEEKPETLRRLCVAADRNARQGGGGTRPAGAAAGLQGRADQRPFARTLSGRQVLLADPGARGSAQCTDLPAPDHSAESGGRGVFRRVLAAGDRRCSRARAGAGTSRPRCMSFA